MQSQRHVYSQTQMDVSLIMSNMLMFLVSNAMNCMDYRNRKRESIRSDEEKDQTTHQLQRSTTLRQVHYTNERHLSTSHYQICNRTNRNYRNLSNYRNLIIKEALEIEIFVFFII